jgi:hypothetical protein
MVNFNFSKVVFSLAYQTASFIFSLFFNLRGYLNAVLHSGCRFTQYTYTVYENVYNAFNVLI